MTARAASTTVRACACTAAADSWVAGAWTPSAPTTVPVWSSTGAATPRTSGSPSRSSIAKPRRRVRSSSARSSPGSVMVRDV
ncbi:hypothetical protein E5225_01245 [Cellulomonas shaoxiangyii]|uniref:Secreted protein n=1 Tax=Cellulomonas shaoxiangyii TaxID=2566013 RepID=A0A4P7SEC8_9CELL|nr:hypothetical protein E5225_01245 [Cellulomonas shaoxiangyii]TGY86224.1 hypothetical protein E5226_02620 [Cellulomonas shaoxiangyii]